MPDRAFRQFLQDYLETHRFGIVDQQNWEDALSDLGNPIVMDLYEEWITLEPFVPSTKDQDSSEEEEEASEPTEDGS